MNSRFVLTTNLLGWTFAVPSTVEAFRLARAANAHLLVCLAVEEAFAVVAANYISFEKAVVGVNIESMVEHAASRSVFDGRKREIDRHLVNLLAAGEMFTEHVRRRITRGYGRGSNEAQLIEAALGNQRERLAGFHATEQLRNAVLHNSLPVTSWTMGGQWVDLDGPDGVSDKRNKSARQEFSVTFAFDPELLAEDRKFDRNVIAQLKSRADANGKVSWVPLMREYIEALSLILKEVREALKSDEVEASELLNALTIEFRSAVPEGARQPHYVSAAEQDEDGRWLDEVTLNLGLEDRILELRRKYRPLLNLHKSKLKD